MRFCWRAIKFTEVMGIGLQSQLTGRPKAGGLQVLVLQRLQNECKVTSVWLLQFYRVEPSGYYRGHTYANLKAQEKSADS